MIDIFNTLADAIRPTEKKIVAAFREFGDIRTELYSIEIDGERGFNEWLKNQPQEGLYTFTNLEAAINFYNHKY